MKSKITFTFFALVSSLTACGGGSDQHEETTVTNEVTIQQQTSSSTDSSVIINKTASVQSPVTNVYMVQPTKVHKKGKDKE